MSSTTQIIYQNPFIIIDLIRYIILFLVYITFLYSIISSYDMICWYFPPSNSQENYDNSFLKTVYGAPLLTVNQVLQGSMSQYRVVRVQYTDKQTFKQYANLLGIMDDLKVKKPIKISSWRKFFLSSLFSYLQTK